MQRAYRMRFAGFVLAAAAAAAGVRSADAQGYPPAGGGGTVYVPYGGAGGFMPYSPGPAGGLGVQSASALPMGRAPSLASGAQMSPGGASGMTTGLGSVRATLSPLTPIRAGGSGMGMGGGLIRRTAPNGGMNALSRPPVGGYPFKQPARLSGPAGPGMGMQ
jgi:hypothetical protein